MNRGPFGPRGPLEVSSERLIREASFGNPSAVHNILQGGNVHPDVSDSGGFTALIAATMNCYDDVINLLLDSGADVNKLNIEGMSALAVCAVLYYPFQCLHEKIRTPSGITNIPQKVSADPLGEIPSHKREREILTGSQTSFSNAKAPKAPENTECIESPKRAGKILQGDKAQAVEAELSEKVELDADSFYGEQDLDLKAERKSWANKSAVDLTLAFDSVNFITSFDKNLTDDIVLQMPKVLCQGNHVKPVHMQETVRKTTNVNIKHQVHWSTLKLLLDRGADPNASSVPMPVIFLAIKAGHVEGVQRLLEFGARTDLPLSAELKGLYPLHVAAGLIGPVGPKMTELLLHVAADPDVKAQDASDVFELDKSAAEADVGCGARSPQGSGPQPYNYTNSTTMEGGRTPLHIACQKDSDYTNVRDIVSILLSHKANTNHLWSGHSPLSLAIASGNELAVDELLANGADPNLPLSRCVGSALCAAANFNYDCASHPRNRVKLVEKLCKAGANILMPVMVGEGHRCSVGTAVDYAHHAFNQNWHIAHTPYHALNPHDREAYNTHSQLLSTMVNLLRQAANSMEKQCLEHSQGIHKKFVLAQKQFLPKPEQEHTSLESSKELSNDQRKPLFEYCYQCGRSAWVVLMACSRCHEVFYCSKMCKMKAWNKQHKVDCIRVPGTGSDEGRYSSGEQEHTLSGKSFSKHQDYHVRQDKPGSSKSRKHSPQNFLTKENYSFV